MADCEQEIVSDMSTAKAGRAKGRGKETYVSGLVEVVRRQLQTQE